MIKPLNDGKRDDRARTLRHFSIPTGFLPSVGGTADTGITIAPLPAFHSNDQLERIGE